MWSYSYDSSSIIPDGSYRSCDMCTMIDEVVIHRVSSIVGIIVPMDTVPDIGSCIREAISPIPELSCEFRMRIDYPRIEDSDDHSCIRKSTTRVSHRFRKVDICIDCSCYAINLLSLIIESPEIRELHVIWQGSPRKSTEVIWFLFFIDRRFRDPLYFISKISLYMLDTWILLQFRDFFLYFLILLEISDKLRTRNE